MLKLFVQEMKPDMNESKRGQLRCVYGKDGYISYVSGDYTVNVDVGRVHKELLLLLDAQPTHDIVPGPSLTPATCRASHERRRRARAADDYRQAAQGIVDRLALSRQKKVTRVDFASMDTGNGKRVDHEELWGLLASFFELAGDIITVHVTATDVVINNHCPLCDTETPGETVDGINMCACGFTPSLYISHSAGVCSKSNYMDIENFQKTLAKFEGQITLEEEQMQSLMKKLDIHFHAYDRPTGQEVRAQPLNAVGWKDGTSFDLMYEALHEIGMPIYEYIPSICHRYWGFALPDINDVRAQVLEDYIVTQPIFLNIIKAFPNIRTSSLNTGFRAFKHLQARNADVREEQFKLIKTHSIRVVHDKLWFIMCDLSGLPYIPTV